MTGHGDARWRDGDRTLCAEIRTVNSRYFKFKLTVRGIDSWPGGESRIEDLVRETIKRGTVTATLRVDSSSAGCARINRAVLEAYSRQCDELARELSLPKVSLDALLALPGVTEESPAPVANSDEDWPHWEPVLKAALQNLQKMRIEEGVAMARDLLANCHTIDQQLQCIESRAPLVVAAYRERLAEKMNNLLAGHAGTIGEPDLAREVGLFAERCDIAEETVRLRSHLRQFQSTMDARESSGRKLDFIIQEMFREANTISSKANDAEISAWVVEIKTLIERMREMVQNVE
jgi:uncharacterized protein (TIGR00255 family)